MSLRVYTLSEIAEIAPNHNRVVVSEDGRLWRGLVGQAPATFVNSPETGTIAVGNGGSSCWRELQGDTAESITVLPTDDLAIIPAGDEITVECIVGTSFVGDCVFTGALTLQVL